VREQQRYSASTMSAWRVARALGQSRSFTTPRTMLWSLGTVGLEATARALGYYDVARHRPQHVWEVAATTKHEIAEGASAQTQLTVAVFHIAGFHRRQREIGPHAAGQLTRRVGNQIRRTLGARGSVSIRESGTIVAMLPCDRDAAEETARELAQRVGETRFPVNGHGESIEVALAVGIVAFPPSGPVLTESISAPLLEAGPATSMAA
jgi:GGDEF domain-containing protein